jgi:hypothetical protein
MQTAPTITVRGGERTAELESTVEGYLAKLTRYCPTLIGARVLVEPAAKRHRNGNRYHVRIELSLPGEDVVVTRNDGLRPAVRAGASPRARKQDELAPDYRQAKVAIREAFEVARRRLQDVTRRRRGATKVHTPPPKVMAAEGTVPRRARTTKARRRR